MDGDRDYVVGADDFTDYGTDFNDQSEYEQYDEYYDAEISEEEYYTPFPEMDSVIREAAVGFKVIDYHDEEIFCLGHIDEIPVEHNIHPDLLSSRSLRLMTKLKQCTKTTDIPLQLIDMLEHKRNSNYILGGINQKKEWRSLFRSPSTTSIKRCSLCDKKKSAPINLPRLKHSMEEQYKLNIKRHSEVNCRQINSASNTNIPDDFPMSSGTRQRYIRNLKQNASMHSYTRNSSVASSPREHKRYSIPIKQISKTSTSAQCDESFMTCDLTTTSNTKSVQYNPVGGIPSAGDVILYSNPTRWNNKCPQRPYDEVTYYDISSSEGHTDFMDNINIMKRTPSNTSCVSSVEEDSLEDICVELKFEHSKPPSEPCIHHEKGKRSGSISSSKSVVYVTSKPTKQHSSTFNNYLVHRMSIPPSEASLVSSQNDDDPKQTPRPRTKSARSSAPENSSKVVILYKSPSNATQISTNCTAYPMSPVREIFKTKNTSYRFDSDTSSTSSGISQQQQPIKRRPPPKTVERVQEAIDPLNPLNPLIRCPNRTHGLNAMEQQGKKSSPRHRLPRPRVRIQSPSCDERYAREDLGRDVEDEFDLTNQDFVEKFLKRNRNN